MSDLTVHRLPLDLIEENPDNPRADLGDLSELAHSIRVVGVLQPITVLAAPPLPHRLVSGHRRLAAARRAGLETIPAIVRDDLTADQVLPVALIENLHRQDLNAMDEAEAFAHLKDERGWSVRRIARSIARTEALVYQKLQLLDLPLDIQAKVRSGELAWTAAYKMRDKRPQHRARRERPPTSSVSFRSDSLFDFAKELRNRARADELAERADLYLQVADHFEAAGDLLRKASELRTPMTCLICGESLRTHAPRRCSR